MDAPIQMHGGEESGEQGDEQQPGPDLNPSSDMQGTGRASHSISLDAQGKRGRTALF